MDVTALQANLKLETTPETRTAVDADAWDKSFQSARRSVESDKPAQSPDARPDAAAGRSRDEARQAAREGAREAERDSDAQAADRASTEPEEEKPVESEKVEAKGASGDAGESSEASTDAQDSDEDVDDETAEQQDSENDDDSSEQDATEGESRTHDAAPVNVQGGVALDSTPSEKGEAAEGEPEPELLDPAALANTQRLDADQQNTERQSKQIKEAASRARGEPATASEAESATVRTTKADATVSAEATATETEGERERNLMVGAGLDQEQEADDEQLSDEELPTQATATVRNESAETTEVEFRPVDQQRQVAAAAGAGPSAQVSAPAPTATATGISATQHAALEARASAILQAPKSVTLSGQALGGDVDIRLRRIASGLHVHFEPRQQQQAQDISNNLTRIRALLNDRGIVTPRVSVAKSTPGQEGFQQRGFQDSTSFSDRTTKKVHEVDADEQHKDRNKKGEDDRQRKGHQ